MWHFWATTLATVYHVVFRNAGVGAAGGQAILAAPLWGWTDQHFDNFGHAAPHEAGCLVGAGAIATRDPGSCRNAFLRIYAPDALVAASETGREY